MDARPRRASFRAILAGDACIRPAIVSDPLMARIAEELGFEAGMIPGSDVALAVLGVPDIALPTMSEFVEQVHRLTRAAALPLIADGDHGYGNAVNVRRFVAELDTIGLAAVTIEDTDLPAPFGVAKPRLIPLEEAAGKLRAAVAGRSDPQFAVIGRTSLTHAAGGVDETCARLAAYERAGAAALFVQGIKARSELQRIAAAVRLPLVIPKPSAELEDASFLAAHRVRIAFPPATKAANAALMAAHAALCAQRPGSAPLAATHAELIALLTREGEYTAARAEFLSDTETKR